MRSLGKRAATAAVIAVLATVAGCGGDGASAGAGSCTLSESVSGAGLLMICEEGTGLSPADLDQLRQSCMLSGGLPDGGVQANAQFSAGPCSHVGALGGCRVTAGTMTVTIWYYTTGAGGLGPADIQTLCAQSGATFVPA